MTVRQRKLNVYELKILSRNTLPVYQEVTKIIQAPNKKLAINKAIRETGIVEECKRLKYHDPYRHGHIDYVAYDRID